MLRPFEEIVPELAAELSDLESRRRVLYAKANQGWMIIAGIVAGAGLLVFAMISGGSVGGAVASGVLGLISSGVVGYYQIQIPHREFASAFKNEVIGPIAAKLGQGLKYDPTGMIEPSVYLASELFQTHYDRYNGEDLLDGTVGQTTLAMSELHTEYETTSTDKDGNTTTHWHTIFRGLFVVADFPKNFNGKTFVRPDAAEKAFGFIGRSLQKMTTSFSDAKLVQLEDPEFEKEFVVNATDQVEARYILSTSMMRRMLEVRNKFNAEVSFAFVLNHVFIAISLTKNLFEPEFSRDVSDASYLREYYDQLATCIGVIDDLALNVRIWGKE